MFKDKLNKSVITLFINEPNTLIEEQRLQTG